MESVKKHLLDFDVELTEVGCGIYGRSYLATAVLLAYCSPLRFVFGNRILPRGWLDIVIFGDTRCGKSAIAEYIVRQIRMGEFFKCENVSFAGLIGGLHQMASRAKWDIVWGKMPLNNGKLLVADEMSSLSLEDIGNMSAVRSSGIAEVTKIQSGQTASATRMVWLSNPRSEMPMCEYTHGVVALKELIGRPEDISRFDFAIAVGSNDVPMDTINQSRASKDYEGKWTELRNLVQWIWRLQPQDVEITEEAYSAIAFYAKEMSLKYSTKIPLVEPNEQRIRIARVACAVAGRCLSEYGGKLVVKKKHVEFSAWFMYRCFNSRPMGYDMFSKINSEPEIKVTEEKEEIVSEEKRLLKEAMGEDIKQIELFYTNEQFTISDVEIYLGLCRFEAKEFIGKMLKLKLFTRYHSQYKKTRRCTVAMEQIMREMQP